MPQKLKIVIIDDDLAIRYALKALLVDISKKLDLHLEFFTSANGIEGLGNIYAVNPDIIILDTTLPKYSGKEIIDFISTHPIHSTKHVIVLNENNVKELPGHFKQINKQSSTFSEELIKYIKQLLKFFKTEETAEIKSQYSLITNLIHFSNESDLIFHSADRSGGLNVFKYAAAFFYQFISSVYLTILLVRYGRTGDSSIEQKRKDDLLLRVKTYPTLLTLFVTFLFLLAQFVLFTTGGIIILNTEIQSIFALGSHEKGIEYKLSNQNDFLFDSGLVEFTADNVRLKGTTTTVGVPDAEAPIEESEEVEPTVEPTANLEVTEEPVTTPTSTPTATLSPTEGEGNGILGISDEPESLTVTTYSTEKPSVTTKQGVAYSNLENIIERSSINNDSTSVSDPADFSNTTDTNITYQLSPDGENWYYISSSESRWSRTTQGWVSSNNIQEVNKFLSLYEDSFGSGKLFIKVFLHSNGSNNVTLKELSIERSVDLISSVDNTLPDEPTLEEVIVGDLDFNVLQVEIFNAAYFNGEKVVKGKVLLKNKVVKAVYQITPEQLENYEARVYFYNASTGSKGTLIGVTDLYINSTGEIEFLLRQPSTPGGMVIAEVVLKGGSETDFLDSKPAKV